MQLWLGPPSCCPYVVLNVLLYLSECWMTQPALGSIPNLCPVMLVYRHYKRMYKWSCLVFWHIWPDLCGHFSFFGQQINGCIVKKKTGLNRNGVWQNVINQSFTEAVRKMSNNAPIQWLTQSPIANTGSWAIPWLWWPARDTWHPGHLAGGCLALSTGRGCEVELLHAGAKLLPKSQTLSQVRQSECHVPLGSTAPSGLSSRWGWSQVMGDVFVRVRVRSLL